MRTLRVHEEAAEEAADEVEYYGQRRRGWDELFLARLDAAYDSIMEYPHAATPLEDSPYRKLRVRGLPNAVIYRVTDGEIRVIAVANLRREPGYWKGRAFPDEK